MLRCVERLCVSLVIVSVIKQIGRAIQKQNGCVLELSYRAVFYVCLDVCCHIQGVWIFSRGEIWVPLDIWLLKLSDYPTLVDIQTVHDSIKNL